MSQYFFDTSVLLKNYLIEPGSARIRSLAGEQTNSIFIAQLALVEAAAAIAAKRRSPNGISESLRLRLLNRLIVDSKSSFLTVPFHPVILQRAIDLTQRHRLRGYDAVHLATALSVDQVLQAADMDFTFVASDEDLLQAAQAEGLSIHDPASHL